MIQGIYTASQGMTALMQKQDQIANNMANVNTTGFKQSGLFIESFQKYVANDKQQPFANRQIKAGEVYVDHREGTLKKTGNPLDLAIRGLGFFSVMSPNGVAYTRNGNFSVDGEGFVVNSEGWKVLGKEGYLKVDSEKGAISVTENGQLWQGSREIDTFRVADFRKPYKLIRCGTSCFQPHLPDDIEQTSPGAVLKQGYLEGSNVNLIQNMVQMIAVHRTFEADQRAVSAQDQTLDKAVNQIGRVG